MKNCKLCKTEIDSRDFCKNCQKLKDECFNDEQKFTVEIKTENDAFGDYPEERGEEIAILLERVADRLRKGNSFGTILDTNGNCVGSFL